MTEAKYTLRQLKFPQWAGQSLVRIEQLIAGRAVPSSKQIEIANDLMKEFLFCECDRRGVKRTVPLNPLEELHVIDVLCEYFSGSLNEAARNAIFLSLFGGPDAPKRIKILCKLASMAISASLSPVLNVIGVWLQQTGCSSNLALQLARSLIQDYFVLYPNRDDLLMDLPNIAPHFVTNFMTTIMELYFKETAEIKFSLPPKNLLEIIKSWVCSDPKICHITQLNNTAFPSGGIPMAAISPLTGLIQWCVLAPLYVADNENNDCEVVDVPIKKIKTEKPPEKISQVEKETSAERDPYGRLHLGVLQSLYEGRKLQGPLMAVSAQQLVQIVGLISLRVAQMKTAENLISINAKLQVSLDRLAQAVQIALASRCVYGNIPNLLSMLDTLPENRMLRIIIKTHQQQS